MAKAQLTLPNGTAVEIEGSTQEVKELLEFYGGASGGGSPAPRKEAAKKSAPKRAAVKEVAESGTLDLTDIVNEVKSCAEAEDIDWSLARKAVPLSSLTLGGKGNDPECSMRTQSGDC